MSSISVIVPVYKVEPYIRRCIDSILSQTFTDFELILIDDGSPDNCPAICDEYALQDKRIHVIHQENGGLSAARNTGIDYSNSEWIAFVDSDDWVHPYFLEYLYNAVKQFNTKVAACSLRRVDEKIELPDVIYKVETKAWDVFYLENWARGVVAYNKLYNKELFDGLRYPVGKIHEDEYLTYKLLARAGIVSVINAELYMYFQNPEGIIKSDFSLAKLDVIPALQEQCAYAKKNNYVELYQNKIESLLNKLLMLIEQCENARNMTINEKEDGLKYLRKELRKYLLKERKVVIKKKNKMWYYECAFPQFMWCYWTCVGVIGKIKRMVKKDA